MTSLTESTKTFHTAQREFCANLRMLCSYYRSVADVCRKLNINRAQFNRYLNGTSKPSSHTLERICDFFGVEPAEIYLPHEHFHQMVQVRPKQHTELPPYTDHINRLQHQSAGKFDMYLGYYYEYYYSMTVPDKVLRGLVHIFMHDGLVYHERLERFPQYWSLDETHKCKYIGMVFYLNDRIFMIDYESLTGNEITQTVLFPNYRNKVARLSGLMLGVSSSNQRTIACTRIVLEFLGKHIDTRKAIRLCGLFDPSEGDISPTILKAIDNSSHNGQHHFHTIPL